MCSGATYIHLEAGGGVWVLYKEGAGMAERQAASQRGQF